MPPLKLMFYVFLFLIFAMGVIGMVLSFTEYNETHWGMFSISLLVVVAFVIVGTYALYKRLSRSSDSKHPVHEDVLESNNSSKWKESNNSSTWKTTNSQPSSCSLNSSY
jgi:hypothetical protein